MKLSTFLRSKSITLCFLTIGGIYFGTLFLVGNISKGLFFLIVASYIAFIFLWIVISWKIEKNHYDYISKILEKTHEKYLIGEILPKPSSPIEQEYYEAMKTISRSAIGKVEEVQHEREQYYHYVESWVHELKTPLTACSLILANGGNEKKLKKELKRADNLTETILYYAKLRDISKDTQIKFVSSNRWQLFFVFQNDIFYLILGSPNKPLLAFFYQ